MRIDFSSDAGVVWLVQYIAEDGRVIWQAWTDGMAWPLPSPPIDLSAYGQYTVIIKSAPIGGRSIVEVEAQEQR